MNGDKKSIADIVRFLKEGTLDAETEVVVGVPAIYIESVRASLPSSIGVAAQNCYKVPKGAFTGEVAIAFPEVLIDFTDIKTHPVKKNIYSFYALSETVGLY